jgi:hypothetical protein
LYRGVHIFFKLDCCRRSEALSFDYCWAGSVLSVPVLSREFDRSAVDGSN